MKALLEKLKLIRHYESTLNLSNDAFVEHMMSKIDHSTLGALSDSTDLFTTSQNAFKGFIEGDQFQLKHKRTLFSGFANYAKITGKFKGQADQVLIKITINGFTGISVVLSILVIILLLTNSFFLIKMALSESKAFQHLFFPLIISSIIFPAFIYLLSRSSVSSVEKKISRQLFLLKPTPRNSNS